MTSAPAVRAALAAALAEVSGVAARPRSSPAPLVPGAVVEASGAVVEAGFKTAPPTEFLVFEPHQPEQCNFKPNVILNIDDVWETKRKAFEVLAAQKHLWDYYTRVALNRGMQGGRNSGRAMTYGEAYQRLFPMVVEELA